MRRLRHHLLLYAAGGLLTVGCSQRGDYAVDWHFESLDAEDGCGAHGVDAVLITGASDGGDSTSITALCTSGLVRSSAPTGSWRFAIHSLDAGGR